MVRLEPTHVSDWKRKMQIVDWPNKTCVTRIRQWITNPQLRYYAYNKQSEENAGRDGGGGSATQTVILCVSRYAAPDSISLLLSLVSWTSTMPSPASFRFDSSVFNMCVILLYFCTNSRSALSLCAWERAYPCRLATSEHNVVQRNDSTAHLLFVELQTICNKVH